MSFYYFLVITLDHCEVDLMKLGLQFVFSDGKLSCISSLVFLIEEHDFGTFLRKKIVFIKFCKCGFYQWVLFAFNICTTPYLLLWNFFFLIQRWEEIFSGCSPLRRVMPIVPASALNGFTNEYTYFFKFYNDLLVNGCQLRGLHMNLFT